MVETSHPTPVADLMAESVRRLRASLQAERIYLDFLVVVGDSPLPRYKRDQPALRALCGMGIAKDVLVFTREEFERGMTVVSSLPATGGRGERFPACGSGSCGCHQGTAGTPRLNPARRPRSFPARLRAACPRRTSDARAAPARETG
jgi:hypothetical protein